MQLSIMLHAREAFAAAAAAAAGGAAPSAVRQHVLADSQLVTGNWQPATATAVAFACTCLHTATLRERGDGGTGVLWANVAYEFIVCHVHRITLS